MPLTKHDLERDRGARWEKAMLGETTTERVVSMGADIKSWRETADGRTLEVTDEDRMNTLRFGEYVGRLGADMLQMVSSIEEDEDPRKARLEAKQKAIESKTRLKRRNVRVAGIDESVASTKMDEDWDTSAWTDEMVTDACNILFDVFYDPVTRRDEVRKQRACMMLDKLISRHPVAELYVRKNVALLVGLSANRFIDKAGQTCALLDLVYILHAARLRFVPELSENNFAGRAIDMVLLEVRLGVLMMQHMVRARWMRQKARERAEGASAAVLKFGSVEETLVLTESSVVHRTQQLTGRWRRMHAWQSAEVLAAPMGFRGPVHVGPRYFALILEVLLSMVQDRAASLAHGNRDEVVRAGGCVMLCQLLGVPHGPHTHLAAQILAEVAKTPEALSLLLLSGCLRAVTGLVLFFLRTGKMRWAMQTSGGRSGGGMASRGSTAMMTATTMTAADAGHAAAVESARLAFLDLVAALTHASGHAAGVYRARCGFDFTVAAQGTCESIDYRTTLRDGAHNLSEGNIKAHLGSRALLGALMGLLLDSSNVHVVRGALRIFYHLSCSDCFNPVLGECLAAGGRNVERIAALMDEADGTVASLALGLLLQLCTLASGRDGLLETSLGDVLARRTPDTGCYARKEYQRAILVTAALLRLAPLRAYNPLQMPHVLVEPESVRGLVYLDLLKAARGAAPEEADALTIADLVVWPHSRSLARAVSQRAHAVRVEDVCDFLCRPQQDMYFPTLPWDESAAGCVLVEVLAAHPATCRRCVRPGTARYLSHCLYFARLVVKDGPPLAERPLLLVLRAVASAANALGSMCRCADSEGLKEALLRGLHEHAEVFTAVAYFIQAISVLDPRVSPDMHVKTGRAMLLFFDSYAGLVLGYDTLAPARRALLLQELGDVGLMVTRLLASLKAVHGGSATFPKLLDGMCSFLARLLTSRSLVALALDKWRLMAALAEHLPQPLSAERGVEDPAYLSGLGVLPASFFDVCTALCGLEAGTAACLGQGFLRRALEKTALQAPLLEGPAELLGWSQAVNRATPPAPGQPYTLALAGITPSASRMQVAACLRLVACCSSFSHAQFGSANDLLLQPQYGLVRLCRSLVAVEEAPRCDPVVLAALAVLGNLAADSFRVAPLYETLDILGLLAKSLALVPLLPREGVENCLAVVNQLASTGSPYVVDALRKIREPLQRVTRVMPEMAKVVGATTWNATTTFLRVERGDSSPSPSLSRGGAGRFSESSPAQSAFQDDRILREQLLRLYAAAGLDDAAAEREASAVTAAAESHLGATTPPPSASPLQIDTGLSGSAHSRAALSPLSPLGSLSGGTPSTSGSPSGRAGSRPVRLASLGSSPASSPEKGSPASHASPFHSPMGSPSPWGPGTPGSFSSPHSSRMARGPHPSPSSSKQPTKRGAVRVVLSTDDIPELAHTRPLF